MRLGLILLTMPRPKLAYRYRGKYRTVKKPTPEQLIKLKEDFQREQQNMLLLRYPYLTIEQDRGHMTGLREKRNYIERSRDLKDAKFRKQVTFADRLAHLRVTEAWD